ncbi:hypothetical protein MMC07_004993 [Pseudocyphellaria aurata]|nr:hypothetical protein [Pseudocyphellaria aurata]
MAPKIFFTGATGYIGGDALYTLVQTHPDYDITCLVRNSDKGAQIASQYSKVKLVYGDLDDTTLLEQEAQKADIVLHHENSVRALVKGMAARSENQPGYLIHTSGTGILTFADIERKIYGEASAKIYDDWEGIGEVTSLPDYAFHRNVEKVILTAGTENESRIRTAIICPSTIYGQGRGPGNQQSIQLPELARSTLERKKGFQIGAGRTYWPNVHIYDVSRCFLALVEAAADHDGKATWGKEGYYFVENGEHIWGDIAKIIASTAKGQGFLTSDEVVSISSDEADQDQKLMAYASILWGTNSRCKAVRARKVLGWTPKERSMSEEIPEIVTNEAKKLGLVQGHASQAAG